VLAFIPSLSCLWEQPKCPVYGPTKYPSGHIHS
jgi:hypothetical protein